MPANNNFQTWFSTEDIGKIHLEITNYCNAACPLCLREKLNVDELNNFHIDLENIKKWFSLYDWPNLTNLSICGNIDEPTFHPQILDISKFLLSLNTQVQVDIATNGGLRSKTFWKELGKLSKTTNRFKITFGIDGLEDTNHLYRRNVDWKKLEKNFRAYIAAGGKAIWQFIPFEHNKHQVEQAYKKSKEENFYNFKVRESSRIPHTEIKPANNYVWQNKPNTIRPKKTYQQEKKVICAAKPFNDNNYFIKDFASIFINHKGLCFPCCFTAMPQEEKKLLDDLGLEKDSINLHKRNFEQIFNGEVWTYINNNMNSHHICVKKCMHKTLDKNFRVYNN